MAKVNATQYAEKWSGRLKGATDDIRRGVARVTEAPGQAAARSKDLMRTKLNQAIDDGTWEAQVAGVSLPDWQKATTEKGINRIASGVDAAKPKQVAMAEQLLAAVDQSADIANRLPKGTIEDSVNRAATFIREMGKRKIRRPGGR